MIANNDNTESVKIVVLGLKPVAKGRPRFAKNRVYTPKKTVDFESKIKEEAAKVMGSLNAFEGPVHVEIIATIPMLKSFTKAQVSLALNGELLPCKRPDIDNFAKAILDGINGVVIVDDGQVTSLHVKKQYGQLPAVSIFVKKLSKMEIFKL